MKEEKPKGKRIVGVFGSGSFATAIVKMLFENCKKVHWCVRDEFVKGAILQRRHNPTYLPSVIFDIDKLEVTTDINELVKSCDIIIIAVPSIYLNNSLKLLSQDLKGKIIVSAVKGIVPEQNDVVAYYLKEKFGVGFQKQVVISGPCHAEEIAMERLSYLTVSAKDYDNARIIANILESDYVKIKCSQDIIGNEYGAVLKNIYAIASGMASGLGYGDNFLAVLVSNAIREMKIYLEAINSQSRNIDESSFLGDLLVTSYSLFSRNRSLGNLIGKGYTVKSAIQSMNMVAEGYYATKSIYEIGKEKELSLPIINTVYNVLFNEKNVEKQFAKLSNKID